MAQVALSLLVMTCTFLITTGCQNEEAIYFSIPSGSAAVTLKEFAKQSELEIIYTAKSVESVKTNALSGRMHPRQGLRQLLNGTPLILQEDPVSGAFAVMRNEDSPRIGDPSGM